MRNIGLGIACAVRVAWRERQRQRVGAILGAALPRAVVHIANLPDAMAAGDFDEDGVGDLAVLSYGIGGAHILRGQGDGTFVDSGTFGDTGNAKSLAVGDFNGDGHLDLVSAKTAGNKLLVLLGQATARSPPERASRWTEKRRLSWSRISTPTGKLDVATANPFLDTVTILLGLGNGSFVNHGQIAVGDRPESIATGDFNGDGLPDLVTADQTAGSLTVLLGQGGGGFTVGSHPLVAGYPSHVTTGDFNGDGILDLATCNQISNLVSILLGHANGTFVHVQFIACGLFPTSIACGDFDGDGKSDLAISNGEGDTLTLLEGPRQRILRAGADDRRE